MSEKNEIKLVQKPVITHALVEVGKSVTKRLADLNLEKQVATTETIQTLKNLRSELNKEFAELETQRKDIKKAVLTPYDELQSVYDVEVAVKYESAISTLKTTIGDFEIKVKTEKKNKVVAFFNELIISEKIDFVTFENVGIEVKLSDSDKSLRDKCKAYISKVVDDISLIDTNEYKVEIMVEYKKTLNVSKAIKDVQDRKEAERIQAERNKVAETARRKKVLTDKQMIYIDFVSLYEYKDSSDICMTLFDLENFEKEAFENAIIRIEQLIKDKTYVAPVITQQSTSSEVIEAVMGKPVNYGVSYIASSPAPVAPLSSPTVETKKQTATASFKCTGTVDQLKSLGAYMKANGIVYENI